MAQNQGSNIIKPILILVLTYINLVCTEKQAVFDSMLENCADDKKLAIVYRNVTTVHKPSGEVIVDYTVDILKDLSNVLFMFAIEIARCASRENPDSCVNLSSIKTDKFCDFLQSTKDVWSPMLGCMHPKFQCPFKKRTHYGKNCSFALNSFKWFPLGNSYWKFHYKIHNKKSGELLACSGIDGRIKTKK